jgi:hypothetical protein
VIALKLVPHALATRRVERRVRGGYMNRWLVRAIVDEPRAYIYGNVMFAHPDLIDRLRRESVPMSNILL